LHQITSVILRKFIPSLRHRHGGVGFKIGCIMT